MNSVNILVAMELHGQPVHRGACSQSISTRHGATSARGYAMVALLVGMSILAVMMTVAMPVWRQAAQREKEAELVFRGQQYARAIGLFERKYANTPPPTLDVLVQEKF